jgi:hypothetical protein
MTSPGGNSSQYIKFFHSRKYRKLSRDCEEVELQADPSWTSIRELLHERNCAVGTVSPVILVYYIRIYI